MKYIKINLLTQIKIVNSSKDFICYDLDVNNKITHYKLTNDLRRYKNKYSNFRVLGTLIPSIKNNKITL